ncbi:uncharacterized protein LOC120464152 isoform X2 [Pimephales promelas]|uniref:uncharacterized protein LOC120464152 isoform X2 n=1 Tax=Pimephales promelas TaxID=90988 RepID=UPI001955CBE1|nr:uncharacterized protein LOC120464152 isoform X2 [Pimephales promelas]
MENKRTKHEVEGYLHDVSDITEGANRRKYFTAVLQEAGRNSRVVVFDVQRHHVFVNAQKDRSPVRLCEVALSPSRQKKGEVDIIVNNSSLLTCVRRLEFAFDNSTGDVVEDWTCQQILENPREYQRVNVTIKVVQLTEETQSMTRSNQRLLRRSYDVADQSSALLLTVWGGDTLVPGKWYKIKNVSIRQFDGCTCLSTTKQSVVTVVPDVSSDVAQVVDQFKVQDGEVVTAEVQAEYQCPRLHPLPAVNFQTLMTRCPKCAAYCKTSKVTSVLRATVTIQDKCDQMNTFEMDNVVLRELLDVPTHSQVEPDDLAAKLLNDDEVNLHIKYRGKRVVSASFISKAANQSSESQSRDVAVTSRMQESEGLSEDFMLEEMFMEETAECSEVVSQGLMEKGKEGVSETAKQCFETRKKDASHGLMEKGKEGVSESAKQCFETHKKDVSQGLMEKGKEGVSESAKQCFETDGKDVGLALQEKDLFDNSKAGVCFEGACKATVKSSGKGSKKCHKK